MGLSVALFQRGVLGLEVSNLFLAGLELGQRLRMLFVRYQGSPEGFLLKSLLEPFGETVWFDVTEDCDEFSHGTLGDHSLDVRVRGEQILDEQVFLQEFNFGVGEPDG